MKLKPLYLSLIVFLFALAFSTDATAQQSGCPALQVLVDGKPVIEGLLCPSGATPVGTATRAPTATKTPKATATPKLGSTATPVPQVTIVVPNPGGGAGIWISQSEIDKLPTSGAAWEQVVEYAGKACTPDLSNQDDDCNVIVLAKALAFARTGETKHRDEVVAALKVIISGNTESGGRTLALGRELAAYVIAADIINLREFNPPLDAQFRQRLQVVIQKTLDGKTLITCNSQRPNNWGTMCGGALAAVYAYLGDRTGLNRIWSIYQGWAGNRDAYSGFDYGDLSWQADPSAPVGVNPKGATKNGQNIDGALPEEMRRGGGYKWPPSTTGYVWEALQGAVTQARILQRAGYPAWKVSDAALCRAIAFAVKVLRWQPAGDDKWQLAEANSACGESYTSDGLGAPGKIAGFSHWTTGGAAMASAAMARGSSVIEEPTGMRVVVAATMDDLNQQIDDLSSDFGWRVLGNASEGTNEDGTQWFAVTMVK